MSHSSKKGKTSAPGTARYQSATQSAVERYKENDPSGVKQKVATLDVALHQLHRELEIDQFKTEHLEKKQTTQYEKLSTQIYVLRQAFDKLADSVMEETEKIRKEVVDELRQTTHSTFTAIEKIQGQVQRNEEDRIQNAVKVQGVMKELKSHTESLYDKINSISKEIFILQEEHKSQVDITNKRFEELKQRISFQNDKQTELSSENQIINKEVLNIGMKTQQIWDNLVQAQSKIVQVEEEYKFKQNDLQQRISEIENWHVSMNNQQRIIQDQMSQIKTDLEIKLNNIRMDFRDSFQKMEDYTQETKNDIFRKSSKGMDEAMQLLTKDIRSLVERICEIEEINDRSRKDTITNVSSLENSMGNKIDQLQKQYYHLCRECKVTPYYAF